MSAKRLYHASSWIALEGAKQGDQLILIPGSQGAEGVGIYFSEQELRTKAADRVYLSGRLSAVVVIEASTSSGWWRTKAGLAKRFRRPRTWHSAGKTVEIIVEKVAHIDGVKHLFCDWTFGREGVEGGCLPAE